METQGKEEMNDAHRLLITLAALAALITAGPAPARQPDGTLGIIQTPNNGFPAMLTAGDTFEAMLSKKADLHLIDAAGNPVAAMKTEPVDPAGLRVRCTVDMAVPPGTYALEAVAGQERDRNNRAVFLTGLPLEYYSFAHLTDVHTGSDRHPRPAADIFKDVLAAVNDADAMFVLITGDLTEGGKPEEFARFLELLDTCKQPTFVCPGNHDRDGFNYEHFFGPLCYMFRYNLDAYIAFDTKDLVMADDLGAQPAELTVWRRATRACRWTVGFSHRYDPFIGMRTQLALFVDDPLDLLVMGHIHREFPEDHPHKVPWGTTGLVATPATVDGVFRMFDVTPKGIRPRPIQKVAATE